MATPQFFVLPERLSKWVPGRMADGLNGMMDGLMDGLNGANPHEIPVKPFQSPEPVEKDAKYNPNFTQTVINAIGPKATPRNREVFSNLIKHLHDHAREVNLTVDEWMAGVEMLNEAGKMSNDRRNETQLIFDILGLESLVDAITQYQHTHPDPATTGRVAPVINNLTSSAVLGPFYRQNAPLKSMGESIVQPGSIGSCEHAHIHGRVLSASTGLPIPSAELDVWHTAPNGLYEQQDPSAPDFNLHGRFRTGADGRFSIYCLRPTSYPILYDGPAGKLLIALDRQPMRPAHIHFILRADGYRPVVTQLFDKRDQYLKDDSVFAVKEDLIGEFRPLAGDPRAQYELPWDFYLAEM